MTQKIAQYTRKSLNTQTTKLTNFNSVSVDRYESVLQQNMEKNLIIQDLKAENLKLKASLMTMVENTNRMNELTTRQNEYLQRCFATIHKLEADLKLEKEKVKKLESQLVEQIKKAVKYKRWAKKLREVFDKNTCKTSKNFSDENKIKTKNSSTSSSNSSRSQIKSENISVVESPIIMPIKMVKSPINTPIKKLTSRPKTRNLRSLKIEKISTGQKKIKEEYQPERKKAKIVMKDSCDFSLIKEDFKNMRF